HWKQSAGKARGIHRSGYCHRTRSIVSRSPGGTPSSLVALACSYETLQLWPQGTAWRPSLEGWIGRLGYSASLHDQLYNMRLGEQGLLIHPARATLEKRTQLLPAMAVASCVHEVSLLSYLGQNVN